MIRTVLSSDNINNYNGTSNSLALAKSPGSIVYLSSFRQIFQDMLSGTHSNSRPRPSSATSLCLPNSMSARSLASDRLSTSSSAPILANSVVASPLLPSLATPSSRFEMRRLPSWRASRSCVAHTCWVCSWIRGQRNFAAGLSICSERFGMRSKG